MQFKEFIPMLQKLLSEDAKAPVYNRLLYLCGEKEWWPSYPADFRIFFAINREGVIVRVEILRERNIRGGYNYRAIYSPAWDWQIHDFFDWHFGREGDQKIFWSYYRKKKLRSLIRERIALPPSNNHT